MKKRTEKRMRNVVLTVLVIFLGVVLMVCYFLKITPGMDTILSQVISIAVAYGLPLGIAYIVLGTASLLEIVNE